MDGEMPNSESTAAANCVIIMYAAQFRTPIVRGAFAKRPPVEGRSSLYIVARETFHRIYRKLSKICTGLANRAAFVTTCPPRPCLPECRIDALARHSKPDRQGHSTYSVQQS